MNSKHTPGPWSFAAREPIETFVESGARTIFSTEINTGFVFDIGAGDRLVACVYEAPDGAANAALIAAAPRMAEALGGAADEFDRWIERAAGDSCVGIGTAIIKQLRDEFRALLREADGS